MPQLLWDASGLAKRYYSEDGTATVNALFSVASTPAMAVTYIGYAETAAILRRRHNQGDLNPADFTQARIVLRNEVLIKPDFTLLSADDADFLAGVSLTDRHNINSTDAAILAAYLRYMRALPLESPSCLLVASDHRLLRAAEAEGLRTLNPELISATDIPALLASSH